MSKTPNPSPNGTDGQTPTGAAGSTDTGAKTSLSSLLESWDKSNAGDQPQPKTDSELRERLKRLEDRDAATAYKTEMQSIVTKLKGELEVDEFIVEAWVNKQADAKLLQLWENREADREAFDSAIESLAPKFKEFWEGKAPTKETKNDGKRIASIARARESKDSAGSGLSGVDFASLSDTDFEMKKSEVFRMAQSGKL